MSRQKKTASKLITPALAVAIVSAVSVGVSMAGAPAPQEGASVAIDPAAQTNAGDPDNPATWHLPIEAYMPDKASKQLVGNVRGNIIDTCMADAGYPDWVPAPDLPDIGGKTVVDWRYGIHNAALAAKRGYHPREDEQKAYNAAVSVGAVDESGADPETLGTCVAKADGKAPQIHGSFLVQQIKGASYKESTDDPAVKRVFEKWSKCMAKQGYSYEKPMDANDDPAFASRYKVTDAEIATALADIKCRKQNHVAKTWFDAEVAIQKKAIDGKQATLNKLVEHNKEVTAKAAKLAVK